MSCIGKLHSTLHKGKSMLRAEACKTFPFSRERGKSQDKWFRCHAWAPPKSKTIHSKRVQSDLVDFCKLSVLEVGEPSHGAGLGQLGRLNSPHPAFSTPTADHSEIWKLKVEHYVIFGCICPKQDCKARRCPIWNYESLTDRVNC